MNDESDTFQRPHVPTVPPPLEDAPDEDLEEPQHNGDEARAFPTSVTAAAAAAAAAVIGALGVGGRLGGASPAKAEAAGEAKAGAEARAGASKQTTEPEPDRSKAEVPVALVDRVYPAPRETGREDRALDTFVAPKKRGKKGKNRRRDVTDDDTKPAAEAETSVAPPSDMKRRVVLDDRELMRWREEDTTDGVQNIAAIGPQPSRVVEAAHETSAQQEGILESRNEPAVVLLHEPPERTKSGQTAQGTGMDGSLVPLSVEAGATKAGRTSLDGLLLDKQALPLEESSPRAVSLPRQTAAEVDALRERGPAIEADPLPVQRALAENVPLPSPTPAETVSLLADKTDRRDKAMLPMEVLAAAVPLPRETEAEVNVLREGGAAAESRRLPVDSNFAKNVPLPSVTQAETVSLLADQAVHRDTATLPMEVLAATVSLPRETEAEVDVLREGGAATETRRPPAESNSAKNVPLPSATEAERALLADETVHRDKATQPMETLAAAVSHPRETDAEADALREGGTAAEARRSPVETTPAEDVPLPSVTRAERSSLLADETIHNGDKAAPPVKAPAAAVPLPQETDAEIDALREGGTAIEARRSPVETTPAEDVPLPSVTRAERSSLLADETIHNRDQAAPPMNAPAAAVPLPQETDAEIDALREGLRYSRMRLFITGTKLRRR
ncbi:MAG: hypothetical protein M1826_000487 [Phylliscum demangeonii]|nr:MAG: hypothetical protein M1826_000487 [Phylliscum demangeonii]